MASSSGQLLIPEDLLLGSSRDEDDESLLLSQPFYPSPVPSLDFLQPLSSNPTPSNFSSSSSSSSSSHPSQETHPHPIKSNVVEDITSSVPLAIERSLSIQFLDENNSIHHEVSKFHQVLRRACSAGDLKRVNASGNEKSLMMVGGYNMEERKLRIDKYRIKRNQRNFNNTIKYACRKTVADSRPRVRGRFARGDVIGHDVLLPENTSTSDDDDDDDHRNHVNHKEQEDYLLSCLCQNR